MYCWFNSQVTLQETNGRHREPHELQLNFEVERTEVITSFCVRDLTVYLLLWTHRSGQNIKLSLTNFNFLRWTVCQMTMRSFATWFCHDIAIVNHIFRMASLIVLPTTDNWPRKSTNARLLVTVSLKASSNFLKAEAQLLWQQGHCSNGKRPNHWAMTQNKNNIENNGL